eukprot:1182240-Prorocentrum_minimum.AAC.1
MSTYAVDIERACLRFGDAVIVEGVDEEVDFFLRVLFVAVVVELLHLLHGICSARVWVATVQGRTVTVRVAQLRGCWLPFSAVYRREGKF